MVHFVAQASLQADMAYEQFIFDTRQVPTRENLHDFFNGLAWLLFPRTKLRLNALQAAEIRTHGVQSTRGPLRDALTVFDENAAFMQPNPVLEEALRTRQWQLALVAMRKEWLQQPPVLFGHALLEKLVSPYKSITAHVYIARAATFSIAKCATTKDWDSAVSAHLSHQSLLPKPFLPLPVLGVPGWCADNSLPGFYDDLRVFRPPLVSSRLPNSSY